MRFQYATQQFHRNYWVCNLRLSILYVSQTVSTLLQVRAVDSPWVVAGVSWPTHQTHKHTGVSSDGPWLAYPLNHWCMIGIYAEQCPGWRTLRRQPRNSGLRLGIGFQWSDKDSSLVWLSYLKKSLCQHQVELSGPMTFWWWALQLPWLIPAF